MTRERRYSNFQIQMHWLTFVMVAGAFLTMELYDFVPKGTEWRPFVKKLHYSFGLTVLLLVFGRIAVRLFRPAPAGDRGGIAQVAAGAAHLGLYAFMMIMPLLGWIVLSGLSKEIVFWGLELPALIDRNPELAVTLEDWHAWGANIGYGLIGLHAAAALFHHFVLKDDVLRQMHLRMK